MSKWKIGDVVCLKSTTEWPMTVNAIEDVEDSFAYGEAAVGCVSFDPGYREVSHWVFHEDMLAEYVRPT